MSDTGLAKNEAVRLGLLLVLIGLLSLIVLLSHNSLQTSRAAPIERSDLPALPTDAQPDPAIKLRLGEAYGKVPLAFEANEGQTDEQVKFLSRGPGYNLFLTSTDAVLSLRHPHQRSDARRRLPNDVVRMKLVGANPAPKIEAADMLPGKSNYFIGNDPKKWRVNVSRFARVNYREVYPGVDVVYYGNQQKLENDFVIAPGIDPGVIALAFEGASRISIGHDGSLFLKVGRSEVRLLKPVIYQVVAGVRREVAGNYVMKSRKHVGFVVGDYDRTLPLVIDPVLVYSTYLGGTGQDTGYGIALDQFGSAYVTGEAGSANFPTLNSNQAFLGGEDAFVTKINSSGTALVYSTFLGGNTGFEHGYAIAVDLAGNAYVGGSTIAPDFPTTANALQPIKLTGSSQDTGFVTKLSATGTLAYSTYLSGAQTSNVFGIATDGVGNAYMTGRCGSGFPVTPSAFSSTTFNTAFLTKLNTNASGAASLVYSTFLGPTGFAEGRAVAVDATGNAYVTGYTNSTSTSFTSAGAFQTTFGGGTSDAFVIKFNTNLSGAASRVYSTYLGGTGQDFGGRSVPAGSQAIAIDASGNAYVTGGTSSTDFPVVNAFQNTNAGFVDAFLTKLNATGSALIYSTYLGGSNTSNSDEGVAVAVNIAGNAYVTGKAQSTDFPISFPIEVSGATTGGVFVTKFTPSGNSLVYSTRLGRPNLSSDEAGQGIALDAAGNAFVTGFARVEFPIKGAVQPNPGGNTDAFVSQIADPTIIGRVVDENGNPIVGAAVILTGVPSATTTTDSNGAFSFGMLAVGNNYTVSVNANNYFFTAQAIDNLQRNARRDFGPLTFNISGQVALPGQGGLAGVTMSLSGGHVLTTQTDGAGNYVFANLPAGRNYTVTPTHNSYSFAPGNRTFNQLGANSIGNFVATQVLANITGKVTNSGNVGISNVNLTLSGPITRVVQTDANGNYSFLNLTLGGNYALTAQSPYFVFAPPRADFPNLGSNQTSNFVSDPVAVPGPTPSLNDNFDGPNRDPNKWNLGTLTQPPGATDPLVTTAQVNGQLVITPLKSASGLQYNGYVSTNSFDMRNASATVKVEKAASGGADTIFSIGSDANNFTRFMVHTAAGSAVLAPGSKGKEAIENTTDPGVSQLIFQVNAGGTITSLSIPYDPVAHQYMRFRHEAATNSIVFETSPDNILFTERYRVVLQKGVSAEMAELSAGTSSPTTPGTAVFDNFTLVTSTFQFSAGTYSVGEAASSVLVNVTRINNTSNAASVSYATSDGTAAQTSKYLPASGTLSFAPGETSKTFSVSIVDNALVEGNQTVNLTLTSPVGSGLNSPGRAVLTIVDNDVTLTAAQINQLKAWTVGGRTYIYVKPQFPDAGYRIANWGLPVRSSNDFTVDANVERLPGPSILAVVTTAQIYDLGPLTNGSYNFNFKTSGTLAKTLAFTVSSTVPPPNPIDTAREFVKQQYRDFLNREADQAGEDFWTDNITKCNDPARRPAGQTVDQCTLRQRETTSGAFFLSPEFQYTGYFVYRMYQGGLGRQPKLSEFIPDTQFVGNGIVVNGQLSGTVINQNKAAFAAQFVNCTDSTKYRCAEFKAIYDPLNNTQYVDKLFLTTGVNASASDRSALVSGLNGGTETRATVLQKIVDGITVVGEGNQQFTTTYGQAFYNSELNRAFVELEYFGYMKRDPDDAGYAFWLSKLNQFGGNFVNAEMVLAFISSPEYRARFGQP